MIDKKKIPREPGGYQTRPLLLGTASVFGRFLYFVPLIICLGITSAARGAFDLSVWRAMSDKLPAFWFQKAGLPPPDYSETIVIMHDYVLWVAFSQTKNLSKQAQKFLLATYPSY